LENSIIQGNFNFHFSFSFGFFFSFLFSLFSSSEKSTSDLGSPYPQVEHLEEEEGCGWF